MPIEIDQSGKIEDTAKDTVIAFSNSHKGYIVLKASEKRLLQMKFRKMKWRKTYVFATFAALIYLLILKYNLYREMTVDTEYPGNMNLIKSFLYRIHLRLPLKKLPDIYFSFVGKNSPSHKLAIKTFRNKNYINENKIKAADIFRLITDEKEKD